MAEVMSWEEGGGRSVAAMPSDEFVFWEKSAPLEGGCRQEEGGIAVLTLLIACVWIKAKISCGFSTPLRSRKKYFLKGTDAQDGFGF